MLVLEWGELCDVCIDLAYTYVKFGCEGVIAVNECAKVCIGVCEVELFLYLVGVVLECNVVVWGNKVLSV